MKLHTLIERTKASAFADQLAKFAEERGPTRSEAVEARKILKKSRAERTRDHLEAGILSGSVAPIIALTGRAIKGGVNANRGHRLAGAMEGVMATTKGDTAQQIATGLLGAAAFSAGKSGLQLHKARDTYEGYQAAKRDNPPHPPAAPPPEPTKVALAGGALTSLTSMLSPGRTSGVVASARRASANGRFTGHMSPSALKPRGAGPTS